MANKSINSINAIATILKDMDAKMEHIEDINADNREVIIKLVKQSNQIVEFLKNLQIEMVEEYDYTPDKLPSFDVFAGDRATEIENLSNKKKERLLELMDEFSSKKQELKEFEEELSKHKDKLTPAIIGYA